MIKQRECTQQLYTTSFDDTMLHTEVMLRYSVTEMLHYQASLLLSVCCHSSSSSLTFVRYDNTCKKLCTSWRSDMSEKHLYLQGEGLRYHSTDTQGGYLCK